MALTLSFRQVTVDFTETSGKNVRRTYRCNPATITTDALALAAAVNIVGFLAPLTNSVINSYTVGSVFIDTNALPTGAENSDQALMTGKVVGNPRESAILSIPAAADAIFATPTGAGHDVVDVNNADVAAFLNEFDTGGEFTVSDGQLLEQDTVGGRRRNVHSLGT